MLRKLWNMLGRHTLCGAALLTAANLVHGQTSLPSLPQPSLMPADARDAPRSEPIVQVSAQEPAVRQSPGLGAPTATPVAPPGTPAAPSNTDDKARVERLEKQVQELTNLLKAMQSRSLQAPVATEAPQGSLTSKDVQQLINGYFAEKEMQKKKEEKAKADEGYKVGTKLDGITGSWGQSGLTFKTPNNDFASRVGVRVQYDDVWFQQGTTFAKQIAGANNTPFFDGNFWRRIRPYWSGNFWEIGEFNVELKLEIIQNGTVGLDDVWMGVKDIPFIGSVRVGSMHVPHGLEADMYSSSKPSTFFEVYSGNAAFFQGERVASGILFTNAYLDQRMTYAAFFGRPNFNDNGTDFANGDYEGIFRLTGLPIWENEGRCFMHLGGSATFRQTREGFTQGTGVTNIPGTANFNTDGQLRDRAGGDNRFGANNVNNAINGDTGSPGNANNWLQTGAIPCASVSVFGGEYLFNYGPFSVQAEYDWAYMNDAVVAAKRVGNIGFTGGYIQVGYFLTGETRQYDKRIGRLNPEYISKPNTPFWLVRGEDGRFNYGCGAWEIAGRFSRLDLTDPVLHVGILDQWEAGVNWHLNNNLRVQFMYLHGTRYDLGGGAPGSNINGFGIRTQFFF
jgi:phosphate-selective porin OprO/OprP